MAAFKRPPAKSASAAASAPARPAYKPKYSGLKASKPREPFIGPGEYILRVIEFTEGDKVPDRSGGMRQSNAVKFEVIEVLAEGSAHAEGDIVAASFRVDGPGSLSGIQRMTDFLIAASGCEDEEQFLEYSKGGALVDAYFGYKTPFDEFDGATVAEALVHCVATRGNAIMFVDEETGTKRATGEYYTNCTWAAISDEE